MSGSQLLTQPGIEEQLVTTQRKIAGPHPGFRPVHAKGLVCTGSFRASADARRMSRAVHLQGDAVPAVIRFSNASGDPNIHDGLPNVRALSVKFQLPGGKATDILANSVEGFPARTPEEFLAFLQAMMPDPNDGARSAKRAAEFIESHTAAKAFLGRLAKRPVPASYAQASYYAEHAFRFVAADGSSRFGRYRFIPEADETWLSPEEGATRDPSFLREELAGRLARGPVCFRLMLQLAAEDDPTDDPTALWPEDRPLLELGRLEIRRISPTGQEDERRLIFDPTKLTDGIEMSADPILRARAAAYSISYERRGKGM